MVSKFRPTRLGRRNVFLSVSHVPSPTNIVFEVYLLLPGGASCDVDIASCWDHKLILKSERGKLKPAFRDARISQHLENPHATAREGENPLKGYRLGLNEQEALQKV